MHTRRFRRGVRRTARVRRVASYTKGQLSAGSLHSSNRSIAIQDSDLVYLIQSSPVGACLEDTMSESGDLPSIGTLTVGGKCPHRSGETLVKCLQRLCATSLSSASAPPCTLQAFYKRCPTVPI